MRSRPRRAAALAAAVTLALALGACGKAAESGTAVRPASPHAPGRPTIGLLVPDSITPRWDRFDRPLIERRIGQLCPACSVVSVSAQGDVALQRQQVDSMIIKRVNVLVLVPVDAKAMRPAVKKAREAHIPVVSYDRLAQGPISAYVSFDGQEVGRLQAEALLRAIGPRRAPGAGIVMMNGDLADPNGVAFRKGALSVLTGKVRIEKSYDTAGWRPESAYTNMAGAIAALGPRHIDGVYAANDGLASGVIAALRANGIRPIPPVTGQDAELAAVQRIVEGVQYMTVYKPFKPEAYAAAEIAVALAHGRGPGTIARARVRGGVPAVLLRPIPLTVHTIRKTVVKDGMYTIRQICTPEYRPACERAGLVPPAETAW
ncbi:substrate-binding domain-containing protein [Streptomyces sparsogenes]|uniref:substrate-binding domain-containing protein n=1 Tax=Streptomyces sparsogenes TaxID=67365 RepID=UPI0033F214A2